MIVRHRRRAAQTAQRCNPVNLEEYGVESVFSSMRRKNKLRRSVRSYLNQAFDDHDAPSNAVNFAGLANLSGDLAALKGRWEVEGRGRDSRVGGEWREGGEIQG